MKGTFKNYLFPIILISSIIIGSIVGIVFGEKASVLKPLGDIFVNLLFTLVVPLVFLTIASSIANMGGAKRFGKIIGNMLTVFLFTSAIASIFMIIVLTFFPPAKGVDIPLEKPEASETLTLSEQIVKTITVPDFVDLFSRSNMLALIIISVLLGLAVSLIGEKGKPFASFLESGSQVLIKMISLVMYYAPIGLGAYFANLIGEYGPLLLGSYFKAGIIYYVSAIVYFAIAFTFYAFLAKRKKGVGIFWKNSLTPSLTSIGTCSSAASIPANLDAATKMGVPKDIRDITITLGANLHKDGSVMGGVLKLVFLFGIFGMDMSGFGTITGIFFMSILVGVVMGAIPGGGMIAEVLILTMFGFPPEALPILAAISAIIDPPATWLNVTGDNAAAMMVSRRVEGKNWSENEVVDSQENTTATTTA